MGDECTCTCSWCASLQKILGRVDLRSETCALPSALVSDIAIPQVSFLWAEKPQTSVFQVRYDPTSKWWISSNGATNEEVLAQVPDAMRTNPLTPNAPSQAAGATPTGRSKSDSAVGRALGVRPSAYGLRTSQ